MRAFPIFRVDRSEPSIPESDGGRLEATAPELEAPAFADVALAITGSRIVILGAHDPPARRQPGETGAGKPAGRHRHPGLLALRNNTAA